MAQLQPKKYGWYYDAIIDWMLANPGKPLSECARAVNKTQSWLSVIVNSDMFKAALADRRARFADVHDTILIEKNTKVAAQAMDLILTSMERKKDSIPIDTLAGIADGAMKRLGYGIKAGTGPGVQVNVGVNSNQVHVPVSAEDLNAARFALRAVEQQRLLPSPPPVSGGPVQEVVEVELEEEVEIAPITITAER